MANEYELQAKKELIAWQKKMLRRPGLLNNFSKKIQTKINTWIPEKVHKAITVVIKQMIKGVLFLKLILPVIKYGISEFLK